MGTYSKPDIIKNDPFGAMRAGVQKGFAGIAAAQQAANTQAAKSAAAQAKADKAAQVIQNKKVKEAGQWRAKLNRLDQVDEPGIKDKFKGFVNRKIDDELMTTKYDSAEWTTKVGEIENYVKLSNNAIQLLEREVEEYKKQYTITQGVNGGNPSYTLNNSGITGSELLTNNPDVANNRLIIKQLVQNGGKGIQFSAGPNGTSVGLVMEHPDNTYQDTSTNPPTTKTYKPGDTEYLEPIEFDFRAYQDAKDDGYDLISSTSMEGFNKSTNNTFDLVGGKTMMEGLKKEIETITKGGGKINTSTVITYARSKEVIKEKISNDLDRYLGDDPSATQNNWQLLQGQGVFDKNDPAMRDEYARLLSDKVIADNAKDDQVIQEIENTKLTDTEARLANFRTNGIPTTSTNPSDGVASHLSKFKSVDGQQSLADVLRSGNIRPADIHLISESIAGYTKSQGDGTSRGDILIDILNQSGGNRQMGRKYQTGDRLKEKTIADYKNLYLALNPTQQQSANIEEEILDFAAGKLSQKPHDKATWNNPNSKNAVIGLMKGADKIKADDVWQLGLGKPRLIVNENNFTTELMDDLIYRSLDISNQERRDLKSKPNLSNQSSGSTNQLNLSDKNQTPDPKLAPPGYKWVWNDTNKIYELKK